MKKLFIICTLLFPTLINAQNKNWLNKYWLSTNISLLYSNEKKGTGFSIDAGRNFKYGLKAGVGYSFLQFAANKKVDIINAYLEKSIDVDKSALFFFAKPGIAIPNKPKIQVKEFSFYDYENAKSGLNFQFGSGIRWKIKRHSYFLSAGYNISQYEFTTKQSLRFINPLNPFETETIYHNYKLAYTKLFINIGFTL